MHITIIEDEKILSKNISKKLNKNWFNTKIFNSYNDFIKTDTYIADLYIIDLSLMDWSWFDIIKIIREEKKIDSPIIITSWYSDPEKKIYGLDLWADDYLSKPFETEELLARIRALLRRSYKVSTNSEIKYKDLIYKSNNKTIIKNWKKIIFTSNEIQFIEYMIFNLWKLVSKEDIITSVWWAYDLLEISDNNLNVLISKVRKKLWDSFDLKTIVWQWYILNK
jgi:DNA-binding response OmpR family regulator